MTKWIDPGGDQVAYGQRRSPESLLDRLYQKIFRRYTGRDWSKR